MAENINPFTGRPYGAGYAATLANPDVTNPAVRREAQRGLLDAAKREEEMRLLAPLLEAQRIEKISQKRAAEKQDRLNQEIQAAQKAALQAGGPNMSAIDARERMNAAREKILAREQRAALRSMSAADMQQPNAMGGLSYGGPPPLLPRLPGESAAAYYMRTRAVERAIASDMRQPNALGGPALPNALGGPVDETSPARVTNNALRIGNDAGESKLLERMARSGLLSTLQGMARAERMYGVGPLAAFSESALDVQAARSAAQQKEDEAKLELAKERIKAGDGGADYRKALGTAQVQNLLQSAGSTFGAVNTIAEINKFLGANQASGAIESAKTLATQLGNLFGLNLDPSNQQSVSDMADTIKASLAESRLFGRDLSRTDYVLLAQIIQKPSLLTSNERIMKQYQRVFAKMSAAHARKVRSLVDIFGGGTIGQQRAQRLLATRPVVTENLFTEVKQ